jgi:hypothetical protein
MTSLATDIAEELDPPTIRPTRSQRLRGAAWRDKAYALFYVGKFAEAEAAIFASERHFGSCVSANTTWPGSESSRLVLRRSNGSRRQATRGGERRDIRALSEI